MLAPPTQPVCAIEWDYTVIMKQAACIDKQGEGESLASVPKFVLLSVGKTNFHNFERILVAISKLEKTAFLTAISEFSLTKIYKMMMNDHIIPTESSFNRTHTPWKSGPIMKQFTIS